MHSLSASAQKERLIIVTAQERGASPGEVLLDPMECASSDGYHSLLSSFGFADEQRTALGIEVCELEPEELGAANSGRVEGLEDRSISKTERLSNFDCGQDVVDLIGVEDPARERPVDLWELEVR
jgi:hypothetical protein